MLSTSFTMESRGGRIKSGARIGLGELAENGNEDHDNYQLYGQRHQIQQDQVRRISYDNESSRAHENIVTKETRQSNIPVKKYSNLNRRVDQNRVSNIYSDGGHSDSTKRYSGIYYEPNELSRPISTSTNKYSSPNGPSPNKIYNRSKTTLANEKFPTMSDCETELDDIYQMVRQRNIQSSNKQTIPKPVDSSRVLNVYGSLPKCDDYSSIVDSMSHMNIRQNNRKPTYNTNYIPVTQVSKDYTIPRPHKVSHIQSRPLPQPQRDRGMQSLGLTKHTDPLQDDIYYNSRAGLIGEDSDTIYGRRTLRSRIPQPTKQGDYHINQHMISNTGQSPGPTMGYRSYTQLDMERGHSSYGQNVPITYRYDAQYGAMTMKDQIQKKGVVWLLEDKLFSRWKERFILLTENYIQVFKKSFSKLSEMGSFLYRIRISNIINVSLVDRRGYLTMLIESLNQEPRRLLVRRTEGISEWYRCLDEICRLNRKQKVEQKMQETNEFWNRKQFPDMELIVGFPHEEDDKIKGQNPREGKDHNTSVNYLHQPKFQNIIDSNAFNSDSGVESIGLPSESESASPGLLLSNIPPRHYSPR